MNAADIVIELGYGELDIMYGGGTRVFRRRSFGYLVGWNIATALNNREVLGIPQLKAC